MNFDVNKKQLGKKKKKTETMKGKKKKDAKHQKKKKKLLGTTNSLTAASPRQVTVQSTITHLRYLRLYIYRKSTTEPKTKSISRRYIYREGEKKKTATIIVAFIIRGLAQYEQE